MFNKYKQKGVFKSIHNSENAAGDFVNNNLNSFNELLNEKFSFNTEALLLTNNLRTILTETIVRKINGKNNLR